ncbi:MAG: hypothetical protein C4522_03915 [Desulfobacteraceae bacterium]|nr:MAG: hypothetical protein C4522_03915 [Desulfobacteraceae bacterium]
MMKSDNNKKGLMVCATILAAQLFVFVPAGLYFTNLDEMNIALLALCRLCLVPALLLLLILILVGHVLAPKIRSYLTASLAMFGILVWLQSNVFLWDYGLLDGRLIDWSKDVWRGWVDMAAWLVLLGTAVALSRKYEKRMVQSAVAVFVLQLLTVSVQSLQHYDHIRYEDYKSDRALENLYRFSTERNVLHLIVDGFQSDVFNDLIHIPDLGRAYRQAFSGFTYYPETLTVFPYTRFSVPAFLAGQLYDNQMPQDDYVDKVLAGKNIINLARDKGYAIDLGAGTKYLEKRYSHLKHDNLYNLSKLNTQLEEVAKIMDLVLFRAAPHFLKPYIYNGQKWRLTSIFAGPKGMQYNYFKHTYFLQSFIRNMATNRGTPTYKYLHVMNTHNPMVVNSACGYAGEVYPMTRKTLTIQTKCTLDTIVLLFERMREIGVYDNTLILIHGDHGGWTGNHRQGATIKFADGTEAPEWVASLASPMLAIKLPSQAGDLQISDKMVSLADVPDTISDIMGWGYPFGFQSIMRIEETALRERVFRFYSWRKNEWREKYAPPMQEFLITGSHYEVPWELGDIFLPPVD